MKQRICGLVLFLFGSLAVFAQATLQDNATAKAQIRRIKLSEQYLYADATHPENIDDAGKMALEELRIQVATLLSEQQQEKSVIEEVLSTLDGRCKILFYQQMGMNKAFVYIAKNNVTGEEAEEPADELLAENTPTPQPPVEETPAETPAPASQPTEQPEPDTSSIAPDTPEESSFALSADSTETVEPQQAPAEIPAPEVVETPVPEVVENPVPEVVETPAPEVVETPAPEVVETPAPAVEEKSVVDPNEPLPAPRQRVVNDLFALDTYEGVMLYLNAMKEDGRLMYGRISTLVKPEEAFFIIVKNGRLITVLDQGDSTRTNLRTMQPDKLQNYKGYAVIWLKVFENKKLTRL